MSAIKSQIKVTNSLDDLTENRGRKTKRAGNAICNLEVAMSYHEVTNLLEQEYYNKASGCSVKAQADNLFDYKSLLRIK
jgi:hypothetical protein